MIRSLKWRSKDAERKKASVATTPSPTRSASSTFGSTVREEKASPAPRLRTFIRLRAIRNRVTIPPDGRPFHEQPQWRQDFPIDWPQDHYVARRDFTKFMVLTSFAFVVGQFWIIGQNYFRRRAGNPEIKRIASLSALPVGGVLVFHYPHEADNCILIRLSDGDERGADLVAYSQKCTHLTCAVIPDVEKGVIHCPCHEGFFDLKTGVVLAGPPAAHRCRGFS